ncbi:hypothetical protein MTX26_10965 [Bradyrhizobium sp. ISRA443]|uniref:hypothetical protein n=1 Tax=unclassified Bradyrhizobium TaxID=2631580 RepID=UPI002478F0DD|nr:MULTISPECIES: hypothetical protein [unclassified Bradyrhizobium]WGR91121.1 hypothetical protein MTX20_21330 [Bradyrhizobium sp. ISRA435]WGS01297.1 hypothetical protein MTX23_10960 [Bradyrhizobium sp. ISRA436]WGS08184.1 hypothetical protein MTX18_10965 [Bradyrhizobium sp. ISRA437]WGS15072.1 hypothetical protein MTX26_10965 [Bradyrhizobium sp. ISRA443]
MRRSGTGGPVKGDAIEDLIVISGVMVDHALQNDLALGAAGRRILRAIEGTGTRRPPARPHTHHAVEPLWNATPA